MPPGADEDRGPHGPERELLREQEIARLFRRASELDAVRGAGSAIEELRATAAEAGISASAFDAALAEMRSKAETPDPAVAERPSGRRRTRLAMTAIALVVMLSAVYVSRRLVPPSVATPATPTVEEAILLNCIAPGDAAELVRALLGDPRVSLMHRAGAPRVLTIRGTPEQLEQAKSLLRQQDAAGSPACAVRPPTP